MKDPSNPVCRTISTLLSRIGDKWTVLVVQTLGEGIQRQVRNRVGSEVAIDHLLAPLGGLQLFDDGTADGATRAVLAVDAAVDMQDGHYCLLGMDLLPRHPK